MSTLLTAVLAGGVLLLLLRYALSSGAYRRAQVARGASDYQREVRTAPWRLDLAAEGVRKDLPGLFSRQDDQHLESLRRRVLRDLVLAGAGAMLFMTVQIVLAVA